MKKLLLLSFIYFISFNFWSQSTKDYIIYSVKEKKSISIEKLVEALDSVEVLFYGEEHDDSIAHLLQKRIYEEIHLRNGANTVLSLEMFDREVQHVMDEYLSGMIKERFFNEDSHQWNNYKDYQPLIEYAKSNQLPVLCANAPFRYVNLVSNKGLDTLQMISTIAKKTIAPLPYPLASEIYKNKLFDLMGDFAYSNHEGYDLSRGQALWDATMAYSITQKLEENLKAKIFHLNGKFHTDEFLGIIESISHYKPKTKKIIISSQATDKKLKKINFEEYRHLGDVLIFTRK